jgi:cytochrome o ubiquinol oxidase subunit 3
MTASETNAHEHPDPHHGVYSKTIFGFWVYLMTDFMLFTTLFATYDVLHNNVFGGPSARDLFNLHYTLVQTLVILTGSFVIGLGSAMAHRRARTGTILLFILAFILGIVFFGMQLGEFSRLVEQGHDWKQSAFLSIYFTLLGTHALHVLFALLWFIVLLIPVFVHGLTHANIRRLTCLRMFWQFLGVVWIFIFTVVYLLGVL